MSHDWPTDDASSPRRAAYTFVLLLLAIVPQFIKAVLPAVPFPYWDADPLIESPLLIGLTPAWSLWLDVISMFGAGGLLLISRGSANGARSAWLVLVLVSLGSASMAMHLLFSHDRTDHARIGASWLSAIIAGAAVFIAARSQHRTARWIAPIVLAVGIGFVVVLALKGLVQVLVEHPQTLRAFRERRLEIFAAQGWQPDSPMARGYERRISQSEATGWFGLSNVYATAVAAMAVGWMAILVQAWRRWRAGEEQALPRWTRLAAIGGVFAGSAGVGMAGGKGGWAVLIMGTALVLIAPIIFKRLALARRAAAWIVPLLCFMAIIAVLLRGAVGDQLGELSLRFRAMYFDAAARVMVDSTLGRPQPAGSDLPPVTSFFGTGPAGFKDAYVVYKSPLSPEDVASPHSVVLDYGATLGVLGLGWGTLLLAFGWRAGRAVRDDADNASPVDEDDPTPAFASRAVWGCVVGATVLAVPFVAPALTETELLARFGGMVGWGVLSIAALRVFMTHAPALRWAALGVACVVLVHGQIEQSFAWTGSVGLLVILLGAAGSVATPSSAAGRDTLPRVSLAVLAIAAAGLVAWQAMAIRMWEQAMLATATSVHAAREAQGQPKFVTLVQAASRMAVFADSPTRRESSRMLITAARSGAPAPLAAATTALADAAMRGEFIGQYPQAGAISDLASGKIDISRTLPEPVNAEALPIDANAWLGLIYSTQKPLDRASLLRARAHLAVAMRQDPTAPMHAVRLMRVNVALGDSASAIEAAKAVLQRDALQRLDPLIRSINDADRREAERLVGSGTKPGA
ncbi:MAG: hypothetical protein MUE97_02450 [Phycisphaerales bacterium]|jgi:hypothetical protein|nr:hypothetical protein [Phycisphaerales bacterium]